MLFVVIGTVFLLLWLKWDRESLVAEIEEKPVVFHQERVMADFLCRCQEEAGEDPTDQYYEMLNVKKDDKNRREKVEEAFKQKLDELQKEGSGFHLLVLYGHIGFAFS